MGILMGNFHGKPGPFRLPTFPLPEGEGKWEKEAGKTRWETEMGKAYGKFASSDEFAELLEAAARLIRLGHVECAAWRVADASGWIVRKVNNMGMEGVPGVHAPTGRGALLNPWKP
jgi:hypothetical protein